MQAGRAAATTAVLVLSITIVVWLSWAPSPPAVKDSDPSAPGSSSKAATLQNEPKIGTPEWMEWYKTLSMDDRRKWAIAQDQRTTPPEATALEKGDAVIQPWTKTSSGVFKAAMLRNYKPLLRIRSGVGARALQIETVRTDTGLVSTIWARAASNSLVADWGGGRLSDGNVDTIRRALSPVSEHMSGQLNLTSSRDQLSYNNGNRSFFCEFKRDSLVFPLALDPQYRYAFGLERREENGVSIIDHIVAADVGASPDMLKRNADT